MQGNLYRYKQKMEDMGNLKKLLVLAKNIRKQRLYYFTIKNNKLYSYKHKTDDIAKDEVEIKDIESIDIEPEDERVFYITYKIYAYKLEAESKIV